MIYEARAGILDLAGYTSNYAKLESLLDDAVSTADRFLRTHISIGPCTGFGTVEVQNAPRFVTSELGGRRVTSACPRWLRRVLIGRAWRRGSSFGGTRFCRSDRIIPLLIGHTHLRRPNDQP